MLQKMEATEISKIREQITPKGDGNIIIFYRITLQVNIREQITPKGDGNFYQKYLIVKVYHRLENR